MANPISSIFILLFIASLAQAVVPPSKTFKYTNEGELGPYITEYGANYRTLPIFGSPFQFCFYNTTPNAYTLGLRMALRRSESLFRWVWDANRGNPVRENATLTFGTDGNLVLADVDGKIAWQTGTANKGVVDIHLLSTGNLVLVDNKGQFVWQSFDFPTDTLMVTQALSVNGPNKLVSRVSDVDGSPGPYSLVFKMQQINLYMNSKNSPKPLLYYSTRNDLARQDGPVERVVFNAFPDTDQAGVPFAYDLGFDLFVRNFNTSSGHSIMTRPKYNATLSILRLGSDGNLKIYTYYDKVDWRAWEVTYTLFSVEDSPITFSACNLPKKCGSLGVCEDNMCVACPRPKGLLGWSKTCEPPRLPPCKGMTNVDYYKVVGVEHFMNQYTEGNGPMKVAECRDKCSKDCGCLGFFYREESAKCLLAPELGTLSKVSNQSHVGYIKISK